MSAVDAKFLDGPLARQVRPLYLGPSDRYIVEVTHEYTRDEDIYRHGYSRIVHYEYWVSKSHVRTDVRGHQLIGVEMSYVGVWHK